MATVKRKRRGLAAEEALERPQHKGHLESLCDSCRMPTRSEAGSAPGSRDAKAPTHQAGFEGFEGALRGRSTKLSAQSQTPRC